MGLELDFQSHACSPLPLFTQAIIAASSNECRLGRATDALMLFCRSGRNPFSLRLTRRKQDAAQICSVISDIFNQCDSETTDPHAACVTGDIGRVEPIHVFLETCSNVERSLDQKKIGTTGFLQELINVLRTCASDLTLADTNEEAANSQALSTRQSIRAGAGQPVAAERASAPALITAA
jgi:hypothetical protein